MEDGESHAVKLGVTWTIQTFKKEVDFIYSYFMFRILCPCTMGMQYPKWPEEAVRFLGTVVTYVCELPCGCGNQTPVL